MLRKKSFLLSHAHRAVLTTRVICRVRSLIFVGKLMAVFPHSIAGLVTADYDCARLIFTSFIDVPSLVCVDPRYMNWSTSSSVFPFIHMLVDGLGLMLLTKMLLSELISMPYLATIFSSLSASWVLQVTAFQQINVVGKQKVAKLLSTDGHCRQWGVNYFPMHHLQNSRSPMDAEAPKSSSLSFLKHHQ